MIEVIKKEGCIPGNRVITLHFEFIRIGETFECDGKLCIKTGSDTAFCPEERRNVLFFGENLVYPLCDAKMEWWEMNIMNIIRKRNNDTGFPFCNLGVARGFIFLDDLYIKVDKENAFNFSDAEVCPFSGTDRVSPVDLEIIWEYALKENPDAEA